MLRRIDRLLLRVPNLPNAVRFWQEVYGLTLLRQEAAVATLRYPDADTEVVLHTDADLPGEAIYHLVDDVRDLYRRRAELRLRFHAPPQRVARGWRATVRDPAGTALLLLDRVCDGGGASTTEDVRPGGGTLFPGVPTRHRVRTDDLTRAYEAVGRTADDLPYTVHFERLYDAYLATAPDPRPDRAEVWRHLLTLRKKGVLPKLGAARSKPPDLDAAALERLRALLPQVGVATLGRRDRLPYTERFDRLVESFNATLPRRLPPHHVWRLVAGLAK